MCIGPVFLKTALCLSARWSPGRGCGLDRLCGRIRCMRLRQFPAIICYEDRVIARPRTWQTVLAMYLLFVLRMTRTTTRLDAAENHALVSRIVLLFKFDSKKSQPIAYPSANCGRILSDATREHQCPRFPPNAAANEPIHFLPGNRTVRPLQPPHVLRLVPLVSHACRKWCSDMPSSPDWKLTMSLNSLELIFSVRARYSNQSGIEITSACAHRHTRRSE